jgi:ankyrin repeat protein
LLLPFRRIFDPNLEFSKTESPICTYKKTFLIWAAELGRISQAEFFLRCGSDVNAADIFGNTGLRYAVNNRNLDMVKLLIEKGSNLTKVGHEGITPLTAAEKTGNIPIKECLEKALLKQSQNS